MREQSYLTGASMRARSVNASPAASKWEHGTAPPGWHCLADAAHGVSIRVPTLGIPSANLGLAAQGVLRATSARGLADGREAGAGSGAEGAGWCFSCNAEP